MLKPVMVLNFIIISLLGNTIGATTRCREDIMAAAQHQTKKALELSVTLDRTAYNLRDAARLTISLKNVSQEPVAFFSDIGWGESSSLSKYVKETNGRSVHSDFLSDARDHPPFSETDFTTLKPGEEFILKSWLDMETEGITSPGEYIVVVNYHTPVTREFAPRGLKVWVTEDGTLAESCAFKVGP